MKIPRKSPKLTTSRVVTNPTNLIVSVNAALRTQVGTLSVTGGSGTYTYSLTSNPGGYYTLSGNILQTASALVVGIDPITILANNGSGDTPSISTNVTVTSVSTGSSGTLVAKDVLDAAAIAATIAAVVHFVPTFHLLGF
jgi:hypothetical protein